MTMASSAWRLVVPLNYAMSNSYDEGYMAERVTCSTSKSKCKSRRPVTGAVAYANGDIITRVIQRMAGLRG